MTRIDYESTSDYQCQMDAAYLKREANVIIIQLHNLETRIHGLNDAGCSSIASENISDLVAALEAFKTGVRCNHHAT